MWKRIKNRTAFARIGLAGALEQEGIYAVRRRGRCGILQRDSTGTHFLLPPRYDNILPLDPAPGLGVYILSFRGRQGLFCIRTQEKGLLSQLFIPSEYDLIYPSTNPNLLFLEHASGMRYYNIERSELSPLFESLTLLSEHLLRADLPHSSQVINLHNGRILLETEGLLLSLGTGSQGELLLDWNHSRIFFPEETNTVPFSPCRYTVSPYRYVAPVICRSEFDYVEPIVAQPALPTFDTAAVVISGPDGLGLLSSENRLLLTPNYYTLELSLQIKAQSAEDETVVTLPLQHHSLDNT